MRKEEKGKKGGEDQAFIELLASCAMGLNPKRYVSFHSVGFVHPYAKYVILSVISF